MGLYYNEHKVRNLYYNGKCITRLALGKEMTRLVEGDDFVRAEWLVGDGEAYINTTHNTNEVLEYETSVSNLTFGKCLFWFRIGGYAENKSVMIAATDNTTYKGLRVANVSSEARLSQFESDNVVVSTDSNSIYINGIQYPCIKSDDASMIIRLFYSLYNDATSDSVKCAYFRLLSNNSIVQNLTPCRLLRPIPAALDANGIARNADECGMYNSVNGLFYGNVANGGAFTVSDN